jgi:hypothetical protein
VILKATSLLFPGFHLKAMIGYQEFAYTNRKLMEPDESSHPTTDKRTVAGESFAGQKWHNPISY